MQTGTEQTLRALTQGVQTYGSAFLRADDDGPFARSAIPPDATESDIGGWIWRHRRENPISIAHILDWHYNLTAREVKNVVERLRRIHRMPIGASRTKPVGYYRIRTAEDLAAAVRPYERQIMAMLRVLRVLLNREQMCELLGQMRLVIEEGDQCDSHS